MKFIKAIFVGLFIVVGVAHADTSYPVTYSCGDGTGTPPENATAYEKTSFTPATNSCSKTGHTFAGWGVSDTNDVVNESFTWEYTENKTLTATWTPNTYNITLSNIPTLPAGYTQLEYLESTGTQYIDTGIIVTADRLAEFEYQFVESNAYSNYVFGQIAGLGGCVLGYRDSSAGIWWFQRNQIASVHDFLKHKVVYGIDGNAYRDDMLVATRGTFTCRTPYTDTILLFAERNDDSAINKGHVKIYNFKLKEGVVDIQNLIPARRDSDGVLGMYDTVSETFFTNSGTGTFIAGPIVPEVLTSNTQTYTYGVGTMVNSEPTRNGYTFAGWCMDAELQNCAMTQTIGTTDTGDKTYYAKWNGNVFNITWNGVDAADVAANNAGTMTYGENIRTPRVAPAERPGQVFLGWRFRPAVQ